MEVTVHMLGTYHPKQIIKLAADIGFLRTVTLENCNDNSDQFNICVRDRYIDDLGKDFSMKFLENVCWMLLSINERRMRKWPHFSYKT